MRKRAALILSLGLLASLVPGSVAARGHEVDTIHGFETVLAVALPDDFPIASLMRADCSDLTRTVRRDGSAVEVQHCRLSNRPVMIPEFQGSPPTKTFHNKGGSCIWHSDYWWAVAEADVMAESFRYTITKSGRITVRSEYPAEPLVCE